MRSRQVPQPVPAPHASPTESSVFAPARTTSRISLSRTRAQIQTITNTPCLGLPKQGKAKQARGASAWVFAGQRPGGESRFPSTARGEPPATTPPRLFRRYVVMVPIEAAPRDAQQLGERVQFDIRDVAHQVRPETAAGRPAGGVNVQHDYHYGRAADRRAPGGRAGRRDRSGSAPVLSAGRGRPRRARR